MADERRLDIKVGMNTSELNENIKKTKTELGVLQSEVRKTDAELKAYGKSQETLQSKHDALTRTIDKQEEQLETLKVAYEKTVQASGKSSKEALYLEKSMKNIKY